MFDLEGYGHLLLEGLLTSKVRLFSMVIALSLGLIAALFKLSKIWILGFTAGLYTTVIERDTRTGADPSGLLRWSHSYQDFAAMLGRDIC